MWCVYLTMQLDIVYMTSHLHRGTEERLQHASEGLAAAQAETARVAADAERRVAELRGQLNEAYRNLADTQQKWVNPTNLVLICGHAGRVCAALSG